MNTQLNLPLVRSSIQEMPIGRDYLALCKDRQRGRQDTTVPRAMRLLGEAGKTYQPQDLIKWMQTMEKAGAGQLVFAKNKPPRFVWTYNLKSIARAAFGSAPRHKVEKQASRRVILPAVPVEASAAAVSSATPVEPSALSTAEAGAMVIRNSKSGFEVTLPLDITPEQARTAQALLAGLSS